MARLFASILLAATLLTGVVWLLDKLVWRKQREQAGIEKEPAIVEYSRSFFPVLAIVLVLRSFIAEPFRIPSQSMLPTLQKGDFILVNKFAYGLRMPVFETELLKLGEPERGDVVVFRYPPNESLDYIKRVIGLPGDRIGYYDKRLYVNGEPVDERTLGDYRTPEGLSADLYEEKLGKDWHKLLKMPQRSDGLEGELIVPDGEYFVMGDNRDNSNDSRVWGFVPERNLAGRAFLIWMNWDFGNWPEWSRIGNSIE